MKGVSFKTKLGEIRVWRGRDKKSIQIVCESANPKIKTQRLAISEEAAVRLNQAIGYLIVLEKLQKEETK